MACLVFPRLKSRGPIEALWCGLGLVQWLIGFPRLKSRGPIEAPTGIMCYVEGGDFPRLKSRGPIEACTSRTIHPAVGHFPRLKSRGPIEARSSSPPPCGGSAFRG